jgi:DNA-binding ferritin-like protein
MKTLAVMLAVILIIALVTREFNWRVRGLLFLALVAMTFMLMR